MSFPPVAFWWDIISKGFTESRARSDSWTTMQQGRGFILPFVSPHSQVSVCVCVFLSLFLATGSSQHYSLSIRNVSSVAGSASTMSGSLSMCSPSRVRGSIFSSSSGNWVSASKLTSPTPARELVSSLERLGGDSPVTEICDNRVRSGFWHLRERHTAASANDHFYTNKFKLTPSLSQSHFKRRRAVLNIQTRTTVSMFTTSLRAQSKTILLRQKREETAMRVTCRNGYQVLMST